jgi:NADH dehydrogenase FAD-containing subunit
VHLVKERVTLIKPEENLIITNRNHHYTYDHLIISSGFHIDWDKIKGAQ